MRAFATHLESFRVTRQHPAGHDRVLAVDVLRGFDMVWIIGGKKIIKGLDGALDTPFTNWLFGQFDHAAWEGFTFYDIIMPLFLYVVGIAMVYSTGKRLARNPQSGTIWKHILVRFVILWILGMIVQGGLLTYDPGRFALYSNTLQAIAAGYLLASAIILYLPVVMQIATTIGLLLGTWAVYAWIPGPGGTYDPDGNIALFIDRQILGTFQDGTTYTWVLSSLNFTATTMLGVFTAYLLQSTTVPMVKVRTMVLGGTAMIILGLLWAPWHPIVKHLWTGSFVLFSGGICLLMLAAFFVLTDVLHIRRWTSFLVVIGSNAIFAYVTASIFDYRLIARVVLGGLEPHVGAWYPFLLATGGLAVLYMILAVMYRKKVFLRI